MLTELVKALEMKKAILAKELEDVSRPAGDKDLLSRRLSKINDASIKEYMALWQSFTPPGSFPCPFCYVFEGKFSPLKAHPRFEDVEPLRCDQCGETIEIPVELLYA